MVIEAAIVAGLIALTLYGGSRWLRSGGDQYDADFRAGILRNAAEVAGEESANVPALARALQAGKATKVLRVECILRKLSPSKIECKTVVALPHSQGVMKRTLQRELDWAELPSQVRADFIKHGNDEQVYLMYDSTESKENANA